MTLSYLEIKLFLISLSHYVSNVLVRYLNRHGSLMMVNETQFLHPVAVYWKLSPDGGLS
jgi:hypothetical protein